MALLLASDADIARFRKYIERLPFGCHYWTGARSKGGGKGKQRKWYGSFRFKNLATGKFVTVRAHRFASEVLGKKECPPGHDREHTCNFTMCVNEEHIEIVTKEENQRRKVARQREYSSSRLM